MACLELLPGDHCVTLEPTICWKPRLGVSLQSSPAQPIMKTVTMFLAGMTQPCVPKAPPCPNVPTGRKLKVPKGLLMISHARP